MKYVWEPFPNFKCENGSECGIGMDCPVLASLSEKYRLGKSAKAPLILETMVKKLETESSTKITKKMSLIFFMSFQLFLTNQIS